MRALIVASLALLLACGKTETVQPRAAPKEAAAAPAAAPPDMAAEDPEPPDAQAKAEAVVNADFNRNKTTMLKAEMTTLVDKTSSLSGSPPPLLRTKRRSRTN
jgi:hypothetical protein